MALWHYLPPDNYWIMRIRVVLDHTLDPMDKGWNQTRSLLAIRSGGLTGEGYLQGILTQNPSKNYLPERYTDFIFSTCAEEWGLLGCILLLAVLGAIILRCLYVGLTARSAFSALVAMGYGSMLIFQVLLNVGMCLYVLPVWASPALYQLTAVLSDHPLRRHGLCLRHQEADGGPPPSGTALRLQRGILTGKPGRAALRFFPFVEFTYFTGPSTTLPLYQYGISELTGGFHHEHPHETRHGLGPDGFAAAGRQRAGVIRPRKEQAGDSLS